MTDGEATRADDFSRAEYDARLARVREAMERQGIDTLVVSDPSNMAWLTGYDGWSFYVHQAVIVGKQETPVWWGRMQDRAGARRTCWMGEADCVGYEENFIQTPVRHPMEDLAKRLAGAGRVGVEMDNYYYSAKAHAVLAGAGLTLGDATGLVNWCRAVKSEAEIGRMRKAARIAERVVDVISERIEPGIAKNVVVAEAMKTGVEGVGDAWGDYPAIVPLLPSGADAAAPHLTWDGRPFRQGEATTIEIAGCYRRYHVPLCRSVFLGDPPDEMRRAEAALIEGLEAGIAAARAGNRCADVAAALNGALRKVGIERTARCGYPIGLSYPPDWGERTMSFRAEDETILEPGMTFHFMPGLWMQDWGLAITESILIREDGPAECFCDRPRGLIVKA